MLNERVSAGIKILGIYYLFAGFERLFGLASAVMALRDESKQMNTYLGAPSSSFTHVFAHQQFVTYLAISAFYFVAAFLCIKLTPSLTRLSGASDPDKSRVLV